MKVRDTFTRPEGLQAAGRIYLLERWLADSWVSISDGEIKASRPLTD
jgi:hypothetical protein